MLDVLEEIYLGERSGGVADKGGKERRIDITVLLHIW